MSCSPEQCFRDRVQAAASWEVLPQQTMTVLVGAALPGRIRLQKEGHDACPLQLPGPGQFRAIIKGQRLPEGRWQLTQARRERPMDGAAFVLSPGPAAESGSGLPCG